MADKDEFKFDDNDTFPETDLSGAFSEGEQSAPPESDYPMTVKKSGGGKFKLLLLLLLVVAGGGAYYFFMMEEPAPPPPPLKKAVVAAPKPAPAAVPAPTPGQPAAVAPAASTAPPPTAVSVAPPPKPVPPATPSAPAPVPAKPATAAATVSAPVPAKPVAVAVPAPAPAPAKPAVAVVPPPAKPAAVTVAAPAPTAKPAEVKPAAAPVAGSGPWMVEAGTFLNVSALKEVQKKIRGLGYEPQVTTSHKSVRMTRLRLGSFPESEVKEALAYARGVAPDAFVLRAGETFTVYAGTFTSPQNIREMTQRLVSEGVQVEEEPLEVKRTLSLVRFGGFADQGAAAEVAAKARKAGIAAEAVKPR